MTAVPECYVGATLLGFVEELIIKDDPEFQWMDRVRFSIFSHTLTSHLQGHPSVIKAAYVRVLPVWRVP